ncbi:competence protein CoiA [Streptococcus sp. zg-JUN1979]|uniref:competence protein CoiA n=1 Tax=Streptococcus sp. zg-JUN1979 TaxID=3391450 RepID=UPI0039A6B911
MFVAYNHLGQYVNVLEKVPEKGSFTCPLCQKAVVLKRGSVMRPHFAHVRLEACHFSGENESAEHLSLKAALYHALVKSAKVSVETVLPEIDQIADIWVNDHLSLEVQCSRLSQERLIERTKAYQTAGYQVLWLLGERLWLRDRLSPLQKQFLNFSANMGFYYWELDAKKRCLRLKYLIYQDMKGRLYYKTKTCSFDGDILAFLRLPYRLKKVESYRVKQDDKIQDYIQLKLYQNNNYWLKEQEKAYMAGDNLLTRSLADYYPQIRPIEKGQESCLITQDLQPFYRQFERYYQKEGYQTHQTLYPPAFYGKIEEMGI